MVCCSLAPWRRLTNRNRSPWRGAWVVTKSMVCGASAAGTLRPLLLTHRRPGCVRRVDQQTQRWADRESARAQASRSAGIRRLDEASGGRDGSSDSSRSSAVDRAIETQTMAAPGGRFRNRFNDAAIQGDLNLPETSGLNRRAGSEQVVESGAAGLGTRGFARWPERDGMRRRSGGTVSADTIGFVTGRPSPGRRPRPGRRVRTSELDRARLRVRGCTHSAPLTAYGGPPTGDS